jgi:hypothetical protein
MRSCVLGALLPAGVGHCAYSRFPGRLLWDRFQFRIVYEEP